ncbi:divalent cation transporter [bacterium]|nr:divalent cation transporter [candidate division CSSED10-310 bacterium]
MTQLIIIILAAWLSGLMAFIGGVFARYEGSTETEAKRKFVHGVVAFGGGILIAAVAFALVPEGISRLNLWVMSIAFLSGGLLFCAVDVFLAKRGTSAAQFMAMLLDFVPEAISLGAVFSDNRRLGILLAVYIGCQNLPEGFNAFREMVKSGQHASLVLVTLFGASLLGPAAACAGFFLLREQMEWTAGIMTFAGGGILYLIFKDIAPLSDMPKHWSPSLGAVLGFLVGMIGKKCIG